MAPPPNIVGTNMFLARTIAKAVAGRRTRICLISLVGLPAYLLKISTTLPAIASYLHQNLQETANTRGYLPT